MFRTERKGGKIELEGRKSFAGVGYQGWRVVRGESTGHRNGQESIGHDVLGDGCRFWSWCANANYLGD